MNKKLLGFVLVGVAVIATFLAFVSSYQPRFSLLLNLSQSRVLHIEGMRQLPCPRPTGEANQQLPNGCPISPFAWDRSSTYGSYRTAFNGFTLGTATAFMGALALTGVGLMVFGGNRAPS